MYSISSVKSVVSGCAVIISCASATLPVGGGRGRIHHGWGVGYQISPGLP